jgi:excinuclease ABC subunit C
MKKILEKLKTLPKTPGVYLYRNNKNRVIYVGKAINLKNRVTSYFRGEHDAKTEELVKNITNLEWIEVESEFEALIVEADLIKRYKPKYNIRFRDDKNYSYLKISGREYSRVSIAHQITDHEAKYLGPFTDAFALKSVLKMARYIYPFCTCDKQGDEVCLYYHLNLCPGHSEKYISAKDYQKNIKGLIKLFSGKTKAIESEIKLKMRKAAENREYERAAEYRDKLSYIKKIQHAKLFSDRELSADAGLKQLAEEINLEEIPKRIECFDISNIMGTSAVGSMVVFKNGIASPKDYRRFQIKTVKGADDFASMAEVLKRRFRHISRHSEFISESKKIPKQVRDDKKGWDLPDLIIIDGGKGQLSAVLGRINIPSDVRVVSLAKRIEEIFSRENNKYKITYLKPESEAMFLVQRIRDEAHRFAITYHRNLKGRELFETSLDGIPGVGPKTKKKLIAHFGSIKKIKEADISELSGIVPEKIAHKIKEQLAN